MEQYITEWTILRVLVTLFIFSCVNFAVMRTDLGFDRKFLPSIYISNLSGQPHIQRRFLKINQLEVSIKSIIKFLTSKQKHVYDWFHILSKWNKTNNLIYFIYFTSFTQHTMNSPCSQAIVYHFIYKNIQQYTIPSTKLSTIP
jgi:hypothetical protein